MVLLLMLGRRNARSAAPSNLINADESMGPPCRATTRAGERRKRRTWPPAANVSRLQFEIVISSLGVRPLVDPEQIDGFDLLPCTATDRDWRERKRRTKIPRPQYLEPKLVSCAPFGVIGPIAGSGDGTTVLKQSKPSLPDGQKSRLAIVHGLEPAIGTKCDR
jgi:hypothetical protein